VNSPDRDGVLTVLTLNIWGEHRWDERKLALVDWLNELRPDVVALQEVVRSPDLCQASWLAEQAGMEAVYSAASVRSGRDFGNAVLSRWPIAGSRSLTLTAGGEDAETRGALTVDVRASGRMVSFTSTHLAFLFNQGWVREVQVQELAEFVGSGSGEFPVLLCGDFNARPESTEVRFVKGLHAFDGRSFQLFDAFEAAHPGELGFTWSNTNPYAAQNRTPNQRIDYVFVGVRMADGAGSVLDAAVVCNEPRRGAWPTDHFGVVAHLDCPPVPPTA
jgi:endonuclease/exonuclease/phosphatase family metal-dependent hydrolase